MSSHTRGPWDWHRDKHDDGRNNGSVIADAKSGRARCVCKAPQYETDKQWTANANLIAAAPDLVEALTSVLDALGALTNRNELLGRGMTADEVDFIFASLAKAYGETNHD